MTNLELFNLMSENAFKIAREEGLILNSITRSPKAGTVGTCSHDGNLRILIPNKKHLRDEVKIQEVGRTIAHELAHLRYMNHNFEFWKYASILCKRLSELLGTRIPPERVMMKCSQ